MTLKYYVRIIYGVMLFFQAIALIFFIGLPLFQLGTGEVFFSFQLDLIREAETIQTVYAVQAIGITLMILLVILAIATWLINRNEKVVQHLTDINRSSHYFGNNQLIPTMRVVNIVFVMGQVALVLYFSSLTTIPFDLGYNLMTASVILVAIAGIVQHPKVLKGLSRKRDYFVYLETGMFPGSSYKLDKFKVFTIGHVDPESTRDFEPSYNFYTDPGVTTRHLAIYFNQDEQPILRPYAPIMLNDKSIEDGGDLLLPADAVIQVGETRAILRYKKGSNNPR